MKRITFTISDEQHESLAIKAETEGLTPSQFAKRATIMKIHSAPGCVNAVYDGNNKTALLPYLDEIKDKGQEHFMLITLDAGTNVIHTRIITIGLLNSTQVHPREVFAPAIQDRAASIIVAHNHPSGSAEMSPGDIKVTKQLIEASKIIGIPLLDHIIITPSGDHLSFQEQGLI